MRFDVVANVSEHVSRDFKNVNDGELFSLVPYDRKSIEHVIYQLVSYVDREGRELLYGMELSGNRLYTFEDDTVVYMWDQVELLQITPVWRT